MKLKVMTIVGTRPEIIRLSRIFYKLDNDFNHILVNTMQNFDFDLNEIFFYEMNIRKPDYLLELNNINTGHVIGNVIAKTYDLMLQEKPDCILVLGDTNSALSTISAKRLKIPIFHMEAGNRSFDLNLPEEINRKIVDEISDINLVYSERARQNLLESGKASKQIFKTGSPLYEVLDFYKDYIDKSKILEELNLVKESFLLVSLHRDENTNSIEKLMNLINNIKKVSLDFKLKIVISLHPRTKNILEKNSVKLDPNFIVSKPFSFFDYMYLQKNSYCVVSDSGSLAEESFIFNFKAVSLRNSTERQEAFEFGNLILANLDHDSLYNSIILSKKTQSSSNFYNATDYTMHNCSDIVSKIIQSYTKIIASQYNK